MNLANIHAAQVQGGPITMSKSTISNKLRVPVVLALLVFGCLAKAENGKLLLQIQRVRAELESQSNFMSIGRNVYAAAGKGEQQLDVQQYPNSGTCLVVYDDGKYFFEKREEHTLGKPKAKSAEGVLTGDELQHLKALLDDAELQKITMPQALELPPDAQALREAERLDVQVSRPAILQQFTFTKERVKTGVTRTGSSGAALAGSDTFLDNGAPYKKTVAPLLKWFDELGKKNKLKESKPQYCQATSGS